MSLFKRIKNIMKSPEPPKPEKSLLTLAPGDMIEVSLVMYELIGKTSMHSRKNCFDIARWKRYSLFKN